jgi:hypothetical protein
MRILNQSEQQAKQILLSIQGRSSINAKIIQDYIDLITRRKKEFYDEVDCINLHQMEISKEGEDLCDLDLSEDDTINPLELNQSLLKLNNWSIVSFSDL